MEDKFLWLKLPVAAFLAIILPFNLDEILLNHLEEVGIIESVFIRSAIGDVVAVAIISVVCFFLAQLLAKKSREKYPMIIL